MKMQMETEMIAETKMRMDHEKSERSSPAPKQKKVMKILRVVEYLIEEWITYQLYYGEIHPAISLRVRDIKNFAYSSEGGVSR